MANSQDRTAELLSSNQTLPVTLSSIELHGTKHTRRSFLEPLFQPLVQESKNANYVLGDMLNEVGKAVENLSKFDIFKDAVSLQLSQAPHDDPAAPTPLNVSLRLAEKSRLMLKTGTDLGNTEGSAYGSLLWRNIFGGAESLALNASAGTRTRSAYTASLSTPVASNPNLRLSLDGFASSTQKPWASHEEVLKGGAVRLRWLADNGDLFQVGYDNSWRQLTGLAAGASPAVRADAGDSLKSALSYSFVRDRRDNPMLPQSGYLLRSATEIAGWGPLRGDVGFSKSEVEAAGATPVSSAPALTGVSVGGAIRAGLLYPLPVASFGLSGATPSRVNDRFSLGGPTDVRGFTMGGLGPRDGADALGGDVFAAGSVNLMVPLPRAGAESPFRLQFFANGGRNVAISAREKQQPGQTLLSAGAARNGVYSAIHEVVAGGLPSVAAGFGLVYAHPVARFELNFSLPLVVRRGEEARKGLQVGVGINFL